MFWPELMNLTEIIHVLQFSRQYFVNVDDTVAQKVSFFIKLAFKDYFHILFYVYWVEK
jgi:hypothetical protein